MTITWVNVSDHFWYWVTQVIWENAVDVVVTVTLFTICILCMYKYSLIIIYYTK